MRLVRRVGAQKLRLVHPPLPVVLAARDGVLHALDAAVEAVEGALEPVERPSGLAADGRLSYACLPRRAGGRRKGREVTPEFSQHAEDVIHERRISMEWVSRAIESPAAVEEHADGTVHYLARIEEREERVLRVVVRAGSSPPRVVTAFLDRRLKGRLP